MRFPASTVVALCACALPACRARNTVHELDFSWGRMQIQPRYDAYRGSEFFDDGSAMRAPPRGSQSYATNDGTGAAGAGNAGGRDVATIPVPLTLPLLERGRTEFEIICATCHGASGDGDSIPARFMGRKPPSLMEERVRVLPDGRIFQIIRDGYGEMPSYATHLDDGERWAVVAFVRALQRSRHAVVARLPDDVSSELRRSVP